LVPLLRRVAGVLVWVVGLLFVLQNLNVDVGSLVAGLGIGGLAFALAAKDTLANVFGSLTIFGDRPFQIGDWVVIDNVEGTIEQVGFRSTRVRTFYDSLVSIPNSIVANATIDNMGERRYRRFKILLSLTYDATPAQVEAFVKGVQDSITAHPKTRDYFEVHWNNMAASSLDILVYCFFEVTSWTEELEGRHQLMAEWMRVAEEAGVEYAFPTQTLHLLTEGASR
jgi:MscS family membrane protein